MPRRFAVLASSLYLVACAPLPPDNEHLEGPIENLSAEQRFIFTQGDQLFSRVFTPLEGLGPRFNEASCEACHRGDGASHPKAALLRFGRLDDEGFNPLLAHGGPQLQDKAIYGFAPERLPDEANVFSLLLGPPVSGLGLLEAITDETLLALEDPEDRDGDGISGRVHWLPSNETLQAFAQREPAIYPHTTNPAPTHLIGRFGRKASTISLLHQSASALHEDMGLTTTYFPHELYAPGDGGFPGSVSPGIDMDAGTLNALTFYLKALRPPERRDADHPRIVEGEALFHQIQCTTCHLPELTTGPSPIAALAHQTIAPYSDLLLHDMGEDLSDGYTEGTALPSEWRTSPLWGLGLRASSQGGAIYLLHDGRARSYAEAIEFHGGEAAQSRENYRALSSSDRETLHRFLDSL